MKKIHRLLIAVGLVSTLAAPVLAQPFAGGDAQRPARAEKMHEQMAQRHAKHLGDLKTKLQLKADQTAAWNTFEQAIQAPVQTMKHPDRTAMQKLTTPERIEQMQAFKAERDAHMQKRLDATKTFYGSLSDEQKKTFDAQTAHFMNDRMDHPRHGHHGMGR